MDLTADSLQCRTFVVPSILTAPLVDGRALTSNESENEEPPNILKHVTKGIFIGNDRLCDYDVTRIKSPQTEDIHPPSLKPCLGLTVRPQQLWLANHISENVGATAPFQKTPIEKIRNRNPISIQKSAQSSLAYVRVSTGSSTPERERPSADRSILQERAFLLQSRSF
jgi:hypothetical protein